MSAEARPLTKYHLNLHRVWTFNTWCWPTTHNTHTRTFCFGLFYLFIYFPFCGIVTLCQDALWRTGLLSTENQTNRLRNQVSPKSCHWSMTGARRVRSKRWGNHSLRFGSGSRSFFNRNFVWDTFGNNDVCCWRLKMNQLSSLGKHNDQKYSKPAISGFQLSRFWLSMAFKGRAFLVSDVGVATREPRNGYLFSHSACCVTVWIVAFAASVSAFKMS